jgi:hypothetical protein
MSKITYIIFYIFILNTGFNHAFSVDFYPPSQKFIEQESYEKIWSSLQNKVVIKENQAFFEDIIAEEKLGFFGYHGGSQRLRILQDIIRVSLEEILDIPVRSDFQFLRIPGDKDLNLKSAEDFFSRHEVINNRGDLKSKQLLSLNIPVYGGHDSRGSCTVCYFANSNHKEKDKINTLNMTIDFFETLGAEHDDAVVCARQIEDVVHHLDLGQGILLQFFDTSPNPYEALNTHAYVSESGGIPVMNSIPSDYLLNNEFIEYPQLRLIMSDYETLNPFSPFVVKRYDNQDPAAVLRWQDELRAIVQTLPVDAAKKESYKKQLLDAWNTESTFSAKFQI